MTILSLRRPLSAAEAVGGADEVSAAGQIRRWRSTIARWIVRSHQRRALREIAERNDLHLLKDMGVSQEEAFREANKRFWRS